MYPSRINIGSLLEKIRDLLKRFTWQAYGSTSMFRDLAQRMWLIDWEGSVSKAMESLLARALESKLKYWLKSFTRDQFKLKGRTVELCNLGMLYILFSIMQHMCVERETMMMMTYYCLEMMVMIYFHPWRRHQKYTCSIRHWLRKHTEMVDFFTDGSEGGVFHQWSVYR